MSGEGGASGTPNGVSVHVSVIRELDNATGRDGDGLGTPNERVNTFPKHAMSEADDSFELDEYAKPRSVDLEVGEDKCGALSSPTRASDAIVLPPHGTRAAASDEWSIGSPSVAGDGN
ncbi:hypothetical protein FRC06_003362 [Ceratobasidium sp. 370]|nr:hypothetical protein FRC06_003362 [Ceratobasidium sp. 370]